MLRAAVVGLGVGEAHAATYARLPDTTLAALCDLDAGRLAEVAAQHPGVRTTTDPDELLTDPEIDVVSIASYDDAHFAQVRTALAHGKHLFVEKPLCTRREEAEELRALLAEHPGQVLSSNLILRASPRFRLVKELVDSGRLGRLYYVEADYDYGRLHKLTEGWRGDLPHYSVVLGGGVHVVDLLLWLTGRRVVEVTAYGNRIASEGTKFRFDDLVVALLRFEDGMLGKVAANFGSATPHFHAVELFGTEATFVNGPEQAWLVDRERREPVDAPYPGVGKGELIPAFVDAVLGRGRLPVEPEEVFAALDVCFAIDDSAASGRPVGTL
ncbi:MAG TPA: Gfo/Idh/MocA family oxidoreductase [Gaiellaceae bacterium]|nr:Gfo/Idh/MocA family oxidoreductase [Gaiellaceae bacterium]